MLLSTSNRIFEYLLAQSHKAGKFVAFCFSNFETVEFALHKNSVKNKNKIYTLTAGKIDILTTILFLKIIFIAKQKNFQNVYLVYFFLSITILTSLFCWSKYKKGKYHPLAVGVLVIIMLSL